MAKTAATMIVLAGLAWLFWPRKVWGLNITNPQTGVGGTYFKTEGGETGQMTVETEKLNLRHFVPSEFGIWWPYMSADLLLVLDEFREQWGYPVIVSSANGALGRHDNTDSQHNIDKWGEVRAVDFFPMLPDGKGGYRYMSTSSDRERAYQIAKNVGFTGIGIYTDTTPGNMVHGDVRAGSLATWSRVSGKYKGLSEVLS